VTLADVTRRLSEAGIEAPEAEAAALLRLAQRMAGARAAALLPGLVDKRVARWPLDRIEGSRGFWTLELGLNAATLSPRPDTETLVAAALDHGNRRWGVEGPKRILDLGCGSGAILLALLSEWPQASGVGVDLSAEAIAQAKANALANAALIPAVERRAAFSHGNWFSRLEGQFDLILSNPPYIPSAAIAALEPEVRDHDPLLALDGGTDGLEAYRAILGEAAGFLGPDGLVILEIGHDQGESLRILAASHGFGLIEARRDLGGHERALVLAAAH
jgi:release factor glutamine methyltransferase